MNVYLPLGIYIFSIYFKSGKQKKKSAGGGFWIPLIFFEILPYYSQPELLTHVRQKNKELDYVYLIFINRGHCCC
jgi:hypothetical protein